MTRRRWIPLTLITAALALLAAVTWAQEPQPAAPLAPVGTAFTYQGQLKSDGESVTGDCDMEFRLYADAGGTSQVGSLVSLPVSVAEGLFTAALDFGSGAFNGDARWLGIQVQCVGDPSMVDLGLQPLTPTPYALSAPWSGLSGVPAGFADNVDNNTTYNAGTGLDLEHGVFSIEEAFRLPGPCAHGALAEFSTKDSLWHCGIDASGWQPANVVMVAKSGGDYASVQAAIDSITTASANNPYLVWIAPGVYEEQVTMVPYVHLQGAGQEATILTSDAGATLSLAAHTSVRDLTVLNVGTSFETQAILAAVSDTVSGALLVDVTARGQGSGDWSNGITLEGSDASVTMLDVTAHGEGGSGENRGLLLRFGAAAILRGGSFTASGGSAATNAIYSTDGENRLEATDVFVLAENTGTDCRGLYNINGTATLRGGTFAAHGGGNVYGIHNYGSATLEAESVTVEGLDATTESAGLLNQAGAAATLRGGSFTARGGSSAANGVRNIDSGTTLQANGISALAEDGAVNLGLYVDYSATSAQVALSILEGSSHAVHGIAGTEITHSRLVGGSVGGGVTCVAVSHGTTFYENTCP